MRCPKCAYVSFDDLEKCAKCSRDLLPSREDLNLLDFRPEVPFLLGSLVGEMQGGGAQQELSLTQETELELGGFDMGEPAASEGSISMQDLGDLTETDSSEEVSLSEIALDDLETIEASALGDAGAAEIQLDDMAELGGEDVSLSAEDEEFLGLEIEEDELPADDFGVFDEALTAEPEPTEADPGTALELDLNEDDLSALAKELEGHLDSEGEVKKKAGADDLELELEDD
jgi:hypothetical protein